MRRRCAGGCGRSLSAAPWSRRYAAIALTGAIRTIEMNAHHQYFGLAHKAVNQPNS